MTKFEACLSDLKLWEQDIKSNDSIDIKNELLNNILPLMQSVIRASMEESAEFFSLLEEQAIALDELTEQQESFLQPDLSADLTKTLELGMVIIALLEKENVKLSNDLMNQKLNTATKTYRQNTMYLLEQLAEITLNPNEEEEDNEDGNEGFAVSGESQETGEEVDESRTGDFDNNGSSDDDEGEDSDSDDYEFSEEDLTEEGSEV